MAAQPNQTAGNWYDDAMSVWAQRGVLKGDGSGSLNPTGYITRGELAVILDRIMDYQIAANNSFADVANEAWYTDAVLKACAAGVLQGDGVNARPGDTITRQEAMVMLARVLELTGRSQGVSAFRDADQVADWAKGAVGAMAHAGYVQGSGGNIMPTAPITRAEVAVMLDNMFAETFDKAGTYTEDVDSSAVISADDVTLQGLTIAGDLIVAEGVAKGAVVSDLTVSGSDAALAVAGKVEQVSVTKEADGVSIQTEKGSKIDSVVTSGSNTTVEGSGTVTKVEATPNASGTTVSTSGTQVENNSGDSVTIPGGIWVYQGNFTTAESGDGITVSGAYTPDPGGGRHRHERHSPLPWRPVPPGQRRRHPEHFLQRRDLYLGRRPGPAGLQLGEGPRQ